MWAWLRSRILTSRNLTDKQIGPWNLVHLIDGMALPVGFWCMICLGLFLLLIYLDHF